jgi:hypothetical protein
MATTTVTIRKRVARDDYGRGRNTYTDGDTGVRAHIYAFGGSERRREGATATSDVYQLLADPCSLDTDDQVLDERTGVLYDVTACQLRVPIMPHVKANLMRTAGEVGA